MDWRSTAGEVPMAGAWPVVAYAHLHTQRGDKIPFFLLRNGRRYKWYSIPTELVRSKKAAWDALEQYAATEYPGRLITQDNRSQERGSRQQFGPKKGA
jgi:hypothetical protein